MAVQAEPNSTSARASSVSSNERSRPNAITGSGRSASTLTSKLFPTSIAGASGSRDTVTGTAQDRTDINKSMTNRALIFFISPLPSLLVDEEAVPELIIHERDAAVAVVEICGGVVIGLAFAPSERCQ